MTKYMKKCVFTNSNRKNFICFAMILILHFDVKQKRIIFPRSKTVSTFLSKIVMYILVRETFLVRKKRERE